MAWRSDRLEHSDQPLGGFKLAHAMLSADGTRVGFSGVTVGRGHVYQTVDDAVCVQGGRHSCPSRWCDCGFYCFHDIGSARDLACEPDHRNAVLLHVAASGRYRRYERGVRYARQRIRSVHLGRCGCGHSATGFTDSGAGSIGWRRLLPTCPSCGGSRPRIETTVFARLAAVPVTCDAPDVGPGPTTDNVAVLSAEMALLQARLDEMQERLAVSVWAECENWYQQGGRITTNWPGLVAEYQRRLADVDWSDVALA